MSENGFLQVLQPLKLFKCFAGSTGFVGSTFWLTEELFDEVTFSEVADYEMIGFEETVWELTIDETVCEGFDCVKGLLVKMKHPWCCHAYCHNLV